MPLTRRRAAANPGLLMHRLPDISTHHHFTSPALHTFHIGGGDIFVWSNTQVEEKDLKNSVQTAIDYLTNKVGEWSCLYISDTGEYRLQRSLTSNFHIYYRKTADLKLQLSDTFSGALTLNKDENLDVDEEAVVDYFLFNSPIGTKSLSSQWTRVGHGQQVICARGAIETRQMSTIRDGDPVADEQHLINSVCGAVTDALTGAQHGDGGLLFSGGVDSTLLARLGPALPLTSHTIDSPEYSVEIERINFAAKLLNQDVRFHNLAERDLRTYFEDTIRLMRTPVTMAQTALFLKTFEETKHDYLVSGFGADALFGNLNREAEWAFQIAKLTGPALRPLGALRAGAVLTPPVVGFLKLVSAFNKPLEDLNGVAASFSSSANRALLATVFDEDLIRSRVENRLAYVTSFYSPPPGRLCYQHLALGHATAFFCDGTLGTVRELAAAKNIRLVTPYTDSGVLDASLRLPPETRFIKGRRVKWFLKEALRAQMPAYDTEISKLGGVMPLERYMKSGVLSDWFERYDVAQYLDRDGLTLLDASKQRNKLRFLGHGAWRQAVRHNEQGADT